MAIREFSLLEYPIFEDKINVFISNGDIGLLDEFFHVQSEFSVADSAIFYDNKNLFNSLREIGNVSIETKIDRLYFPKEHFNSSIILSLDFSFKDFISVYGEFIFFIRLVDIGRVVDSAGTGEDRFIDFNEKVSFTPILFIKKLNFISWKYVPIEHPFLSLLYYGKIIHFKDLDEFNEFENEFFNARVDALCPVCGKPKGRHLKYCFVDISKIPQHYYVCSKECLRSFMRNSGYYIALLNKYGTNP